MRKKRNRFSSIPVKVTLGLIGITIVGPIALAQDADEGCHELLSFTAKKLGSSQSVNFCDEFKGKTLLIVNTASQCGFTPQFKQLEKLHQEMGDSLAVVGFPSDDFKQEYADSSKVAEVCFQNYGVSFTMLEPSTVTGEGANALFKQLANKTDQQPTWNFNKYLVSENGNTVKYYPSRVIGQELKQAIEQLQQTGESGT